ncbi:MAG: purine-binding chemotaxis protein CheW [Oligoflexia bacterium]|nr:purine-binding chemotaxis protein CheW [Oligoflexia bacterium]MBF0366322.1 purine-binding chemotaxis protein CheW [Oligoflexia bacterium]
MNTVEDRKQWATSEKKSENNLQYSTFLIGDRLYGIDVMRVQEVTKAITASSIPLAPEFVHGLINLRGQIATAIDLRRFFRLKSQRSDDQLNVVCSLDGNLLAFLVDQIGDVMEVSSSCFETPPETIEEGIRKYMSGVYKLPNQLLSILDVSKIVSELNK